MRENHNLWAPWRGEYLQSLSPESPDSDPAGGGDASPSKAAGSVEPDNGASGCFLCDYWRHPEKDPEQLVLWRSERVLVVMNRYPYTGGHLLVAPAAHVASLDQLPVETMTEWITMARDATAVLERVLQPQGINFGVNMHRCAGAGLPGHLHMHVVPRWEGDTNFMSVCDDVRVISQSLTALYTALRQAAESLGFCHG